MSGKSTSILIGVLTYVLLGTVSTFFSSGGILDGVFGCLVVLLSAAVGVWHYTSTNTVTISGGEGAGMGALIGLIGAVIAGALGYFLISIGALPDPMIAAEQRLRDQGMSADEIDQAMGFAESFSSPLFGMLIGAVFGLIGGAIGGAIGAALFKKGGPEPTADAGY